jgi:hypothetical protein
VKPSVGARFVAPANIGIEAAASDGDGVVVSVALLAGTNTIATLPLSPFAATWTNVAPGTYTLTARVLDNDGASNTSSAVVVVVSTNQPPRVTLTTPTNGAAFFTPINLTLVAEGFDLDGTVTNVDFFAGTNFVGQGVAGTPVASFSLTWTNPPSGSFPLVARAADDRGATGASAPIQVTINQPAPIQLGVTGFTPEADFQFSGRGEPGGRVVIEGSTNLVDWLPLSTNALPDGTFLFVDPESPWYRERFYRAWYTPW